MSQANPYNASLPNPSYPQSNYPADYFQPIRNFDLVRLIKAPFTSPNWLMNSLCMIVCGFLSMFVVGTLVAFGYMAEVAESRTGGRDRNWPDFSIDRFTDYLMRGLWPFLWQIIWTLPTMILILVPAGLTAGIAGTLGQNEQTIPAVIVGTVGVAATIFCAFLAGLLSLASFMGAMLGNDFMKGADFRWISSFVGKMWGTTIVALILFGVTSMIFNTIGILMCFVGVFLTSGLTQMMTADLFAQLHDIFVSQGGEPVVPVPSGEPVIEAQII